MFLGALAAASLTVLSAFAANESQPRGLILTPEQLRQETQDRHCWVFLMPTEQVESATKNFLSDTAYELLRRPGLEACAQLTIDVFEQINRHKISVGVREGQKSLFSFESDKLWISAELGEKLLKNTASRDPGQLIQSTSHSFDAAVSWSWLEALIERKNEGLWAQHALKERWRHSFEGSNTDQFKLDEQALARELWPLIMKTTEHEQFDVIARWLAPDYGEQLSSPADLGSRANAYPSAVLGAFMAAGEFHQAFEELGARAVLLERATRFAHQGLIKPLAARKLSEDLRRSFDELYFAISRKLDGRLIVLPNQ